jgi:hypothetical protein
MEATAPPGLSFTSVVVLPPNLKKAVVRRLVFEVAIPPDRAPSVAAAIAGFLVSAEFPIQREDKGKTLDLRPLVDQLELVEHTLRMGLVMTPAGSARPREVLTAVGAEDLEALGVLIVRTAVELEDDRTIYGQPVPATRTATAALESTSPESTNHSGVLESGAPRTN